MAADSTMLRTRKRFTALSLGTMEPEASQNTRLTCWDERGMTVSVVFGAARGIGFSSQALKSRAEADGASPERARRRACTHVTTGTRGLVAAVGASLLGHVVV